MIKIMPIKSYTGLDVWKTGMEIVEFVYKGTMKFPKEEVYGLSSQMRRCAVSVPSNIAEGFNRFSKAEFSRFLQISLGSCAELETQCRINCSLGYLRGDEFPWIMKKLDHLSRMLKRLIQKNNSFQ